MTDLASEVKVLLNNLPKKVGDPIESQTINFISLDYHGWRETNNLEFHRREDLQKFNELRELPGIFIIDTRFLNNRVRSSDVALGITYLMEKMKEISDKDPGSKLAFKIDIIKA